MFRYSRHGENTGKTTTMVGVVRYLYEKGKTIFLTGIGYDGEDFDNITGLPKPRITIPEGAFVASALPLIRASTSSFRNLKDTGVQCALGRIFIGQAVSPGRIVIAGPNSVRGLSQVLRHVPEEATALVDGAFCRLSPMVLASHFLMSTGAAHSPDASVIASELNTISVLFALPVWDKEELPPINGGLLLIGQGEELVRKINDGCREVHVEGVVNPQVFLEVIQGLSKGNNRKITFLFSHPLHLMMSGNIRDWQGIFKKAGNLGCKIMVKRSFRFLGSTINPYLPLDQGGSRYIASSVPPREYLAAIRSKCNTPCTDVVLEGYGMIHSWLDREILDKDHFKE